MYQTSNQQIKYKQGGYDQVSATEPFIQHQMQPKLDNILYQDNGMVAATS